MEPHLAGLTPDQGSQLGMLDTFAEGYKKGERAGGRLGRMIGIVAVALTILILLSVVHC